MTVFFSRQAHLLYRNFFKSQAFSKKTAPKGGFSCSIQSFHSKQVGGQDIG